MAGDAFEKLIVLFSLKKKTKFENSRDVTGQVFESHSNKRLQKMRVGNMSLLKCWVEDKES